MDHSPDDSDSDQVSEAIHLAEVAASFKFYVKHAFAELGHVQQQLNQMQPHHQTILMGTLEKNLRRRRECVLQNHRFLNLILEQSKQFIGDTLESAGVNVDDIRVSSTNHDKVTSTLRQFMRDWSSEGQMEREQSYRVLLEELCSRYPNESDRRQVRVLTPGAGLGRLTWEVAARGFVSEGNEFSYHMLLSSHFLLNCSTAACPNELYPFVHQHNNVIRGMDSCRPVSVPDVDPSCLCSDSNLSMVAGEFIEVYGERKEFWDVVLTCFFIDTAHNVADYVETIAAILKPGGFWINLGPLLYHYSEMPNELSIPLSFDEIKMLFEPHGLELLAEQIPVHCNYVCNQRSMMQVRYSCVMWTCRKRDSIIH